VRFEPSTPRPLATMPARPHSSPAFAFNEGTFTALAEVVPDITSAKEVSATAVAVSIFFKDIGSPNFFLSRVREEPYRIGLERLREGVFSLRLITLW
jgi:hypothetical protein